MADAADIAQAINEQFQQDALDEHFRRGMRNAGRLAVGECLECGAQIPEGRRVLVPGVTLCIHCQTECEILSHWRSL